MFHKDPVYRHGVWDDLLPHQRRQLAALCPRGRAAELLSLELAWWAA